MQKLNARIVSFCLILVFSQKMGLELWLHNWLHETTVAASVSRTPKDSEGGASLQHLQVKCHCIDDALNPLMEAEQVDYSIHPRPSAPPLCAGYASWISAEKTFSSLRGPPHDDAPLS